MRRLPLLALLLLVLLPLPPAAAVPTVQAPGEGAVSVVPAPGSAYADGARLVVRGLRAGDRLTDRVVVVNAGDTPLRVAVYPADGAPAAGGGFGFTERGAATSEVGAWMRLSADELQLPPRTQAEVGLELVVGPDPYDGLNVGAVVAEPLDQQAAGQLPSRTRYAMPVSVVVEGGRPRPSPGSSPDQGSPPLDPTGGPVQLRDLEPGPRGDRYCPAVTLGNAGSGDGQVTLDVVVDGPLTGASGATSTQVVPPAASSRRVQLPCLDRPLGPGRVTVSLGDGDEALDEGVFWAPWPVWVSLLFLLLLIGALVTTFLRGLRGRQDSGPDAAPTGHQ